MGPESRQDRASGLFTWEGGESGGRYESGPKIVDFIVGIFIAVLLTAFVLNSISSCVDRSSRRVAEWEEFQKGEKK